MTISFADAMRKYHTAREERIKIFYDRFAYKIHITPNEFYDMTMLHGSIYFMSHHGNQSRCVIIMGVDGAFESVDPLHKMVMIDETLDDLVDISLKDDLPFI